MERAVRTVDRMKLLLLADSETERRNIVGMLGNIDYIQLAGDFIDEEPIWEAFATLLS